MAWTVVVALATRVLAARLWLAAMVLTACCLGTADQSAAADVPGRHIDVPVLLDGVDTGDIDAEFDETNRLRTLDAATLLGFMKSVLSDKIYDLATAAVSGKSRIAPDALSSTGIGIEFDTANLAIALAIPVELRRNVDLHLGGFQLGSSQLPAAKPASASAYINLRVRQDYLTNEAVTRQGWQPTVIDVEGAATLFGATLESVATYNSVATGVWSRGDTRLVYDLPTSRIRLSAGDISYQLDGFQSFQRAGGISVGRDFALQPYRSSAPSGDTRVLLDRHSRVDVIVNGQRVETLTLGPGQYNVRDFPFASGANDVSLRVTDDVGRVETINYPFVYDATVLGAGEQDFQYAFGVVSSATLHGRQYDTAEKVYSLYHAVGLSDQITIGASAQGSDRQTMAGLEARWATSIGTFRLDGAGSSNPTGDGYAVRLQYRYVDAIGPHTSGRSAELSANYRSASFSTLGLLGVTNPISLDLGIRYGQLLFGSVYGSAAASWQKGRGSTGDNSSFDLGVTTPVIPNVNAYVLLNHSRSSTGRVDNRIFVSFSWFPSGSGHSVTASQDTRQSDSRVQWHYTPRYNVNSIEADAQAERNDAETLVRAEADYRGYRFDASLIHDSTFDRTSQGLSQHRTTVDAGTALVFADGHFAVSRPVSDSFALIVPHPTLSRYQVEVNPEAGSAQARTDILGAAVLPELTSYYRYQVLLDAPDLPTGLDVGPDLYMVHPRYRSGTVIPAGTGATVLLQVQLVDFADQPLDLELGTITSLAAPKLAPVDFFSNKQGQVHVTGVSPGKVKIVLKNYPESEVVIVVPENTVGPYDAGKVKMSVVALPTTRVP